jgi:hypothetical protein
MGVDNVRGLGREATEMLKEKGYEQTALAIDYALEQLLDMAATGRVGTTAARKLVVEARAVARALPAKGGS